jgi:hypothetical protein
LSKRLDISGKSFRVRRGKLVEIPEKWVGKTLSGQTKRKRQSKLTRKQKNQGLGKVWKNPKKEIGWGTCIYLRRSRGEDVFNEIDEY